MTSEFPTGILLISLDFELYWGVRDKRSLESYRENLMGTREAVLGILSLFDKYSIHATWSTVGLLFLNSRQDISDRLPSKRPGYNDENLCPYHYVDSHTELEKAAHFAPELIQRLACTEGQEIGTHTFSHFYCLEKGVALESFRADIAQAQEIGSARGLPPRSLVFPRNQWREDFLPLLPSHGISSYRGVENHPIYRATASHEQGLLRRGLRLADSYLNLTGYHTFGPNTCGKVAPYNLPASRFLRPYNHALRKLDGWKTRRITSALRYAAKQKQAFHLWWHPHNFGKNLSENLTTLETVLKEYRELRRLYGMRSLSMAELAASLAEPS